MIVDAPYWEPGSDDDIIEPTSISIDALGRGETMLNVSLLPMNASTVLEWRSSDTSLATVENGRVVINGTYGEVTLTAVTENGLEASVTFSVSGGEFTGVDAISAEEFVTVYDITGRCLILNGISRQFDALPAGIYIVNGRKIVK